MEVEQAFRMLLENKLQSAPVWDQTESRFVGFLELRDLVSYALVESDDAGKHGKPSGGLVIFVILYTHVTYDDRVWVRLTLCRLAKPGRRWEFIFCA
jgi:CBS domain containing-hemolysin-like protein